MDPAQYRPARTWSTRKRVQHAIRHVQNGETIAESARKYGVDPKNLGKRVRKLRSEAEAAAGDPDTGETVSGDLIPLQREKDGLPRSRDGEFVLPAKIEDFVETYFGHIECPDCERRHPTPDFHKEWWDLIQDADEKRVVINVGPYHSKSTCVTVWSAVYEIVRNPNVRIAIVSASERLAKDFLSQIKSMLTNRRMYENADRNLIDDFGPFEPEDNTARWGATQMDVAQKDFGSQKDATVTALGAGNQIYGSRFDRIYFDDVATIKNQRNPEQVTNMMSWIDKECLNRVGKNKGKVVFVGTRIYPGDIYSILSEREGYTTVRYPCIVDEEGELTLWPDHISYDMACSIRAEMSIADFQLVYQNIDTAGLGGSFAEENVHAARNKDRILGQFNPDWPLFLGIDFAGPGKKSGYTAFVLLGVDRKTGKRYVVDFYREKSMKAPDIQAKILAYVAAYPQLKELRPETNGLQANLVQYNETLMAALAMKGVNVQGHLTHGGNKWDREFGVETMGPFFNMDLNNKAVAFDMPYGSAETRRLVDDFEKELIGFPHWTTSDLVMALWFADLGVRDELEQADLANYHRMSKKWPKRIHRKRKRTSFTHGHTRGVPMSEQSLPVDPVTGRPMYGAPAPHSPWGEPEPDQIRYVNVERSQ